MKNYYAPRPVRYGIVFALAVSAAQATAFAESPESEYVEMIEQILPLEAGGSFSLANRNGSCELTTWDRNEVRIVAEKRMRLGADGPSWLWRVLGLKTETVETAEDANSIFAKLSVEVSGDAHSRNVVTHYPEGTTGIQFSVTYTITAPRNANIQLETVNGALRVDNVIGDVRLKTTSGALTAEGIEGLLEARTTNGRLQIEDVNGEVRARTTNGSVEVWMPSGKPLTDPISLQSVNGRVRLYLPETAEFQLNAHTTNGSVSCDFPLTDSETQSRKRLDGRVGSTGPRIEMQTVNGSVRVSSL